MKTFLALALCVGLGGCGLLDKLRKKADAGTDTPVASAAPEPSVSANVAAADTPVSSASAIPVKVNTAAKAKDPLGSGVSDAGKPDASAVAATGVYVVGDKLNVEWKGVAYPATVIQVVAKDQYRIHYDGYDKKWDEVVGPSRIKGKR